MPVIGGICLHYIHFNTTNVLMEFRLKHIKICHLKLEKSWNI